MDAVLDELISRVQAAADARRPLRIRAGGTKDFYGNAPRGDLLDPRVWSGIESHEPSELVITVRAGTPLREVEDALAATNQMLAFEPPHFGEAATIGGCVAAGLSGPRRNSAGYTHGGVRDSVLGARLLDGRGRLLRFGGTVIKNVAGYDVSRVLAGSLGMLGVIIDVSLKVLPRPATEATLRFDLDEAQALHQLNQWGGRPLPISASCWRDGQLWLRLSGSQAAVSQAAQSLCQEGRGGDCLDATEVISFWRDLREQNAGWFAGATALWRVSVPTTAEPLDLGDQCIEWGGALRWVRTSMPATTIRERARVLGGHATLFRGEDRSQGVFTPLAAPLAAIHQRLKEEFDPARIFNPGRMYEGL
ncbi:MAG: glycolate oxidase subunit GlcE [Pseudomonadota bacterium]